MFEVITWTISAASIAGVMLNIHHKRACFVVWGITNLAWFGIDASREIWAQAALQAVYCGLSVYGFIRWKARS
jgi:hypothetical protein